MISKLIGGFVCKLSYFFPNPNKIEPISQVPLSTLLKAAASPLVTNSSLTSALCPVPRPHRHSEGRTRHLCARRHDFTGAPLQAALLVYFVLLLWHSYLSLRVFCLLWPLKIVWRTKAVLLFCRVLTLAIPYLQNDLERWNFFFLF